MRRTKRAAEGAGIKGRGKALNTVTTENTLEKEEMCVREGEQT